MKIFLVGGAVRDRLLNRPVKERDWVVVGATPTQMEALGYRQVGKDFPVFLHPTSGEEYALARTEKKAGSGYYGFICDFTPAVTLEEDLKRRDLTVNAMAEDKYGTLVDPHGGQADLEARLLRHVSPAFVEDPLRVLRVARFAARYAPLGFTVAKETLALMEELAASGELQALTAERVWLEVEKALAEDTPRVFFEVLRACGALKVLLPELDTLFGIPNPPQWHPEIDTGLHTLMVLEQAARLSPEISVRFAALCHDLGKGQTPAEHWPRHHGHEKAGVALIEQLCARLKAPNSCRDLARLVCRYHGQVHQLAQLRPGTVLKLLDSLDAWRRPERLAPFALACEADHRGRLGLESEPYPEREWLLAAYQEAAAVAVKPFVEQGLKGPAIRQALNQERIRRLKALRREWSAGEQEPPQAGAE